MADDELKDGLDLDLDLRHEGKSIGIARNKFGDLYFLDTTGPCGTPNPVPPTHIDVYLTEFGKADVALDKDSAELTPEL